jgi:hypothetical protein
LAKSNDCRCFNRHFNAVGNSSGNNDSNNYDYGCCNVNGSTAFADATAKSASSGDYDIKHNPGNIFGILALPFRLYIGLIDEPIKKH